MSKEIAQVPNAGKREIAKTLAYGGGGTLAVATVAAFLPFVNLLGLSLFMIVVGMYMLAKY